MFENLMSRPRRRSKCVAPNAAEIALHSGEVGEVTRENADMKRLAAQAK